MSYLTRPRIGFIAGDAMTNPSTANNENVIHLLDIAGVQYLNPPQLKPSERLVAASPQGAESTSLLPAMTDVAYREWMTSLITAADPPDSQVEPTQPNWQPTMPGYWNYYGDHLTTFGGARINGAWLPGGSVGQAVADPLVGAYVTFTAKLVDLDPADMYTSQLISAGLTVVGHDPAGNLTELIAGIPSIAHSRWLNPFRPHGGGTFQSVIPNDSLSFIPQSQAPQSPALEALRAGAASGGGLLLRYCMYNLKAQFTMQEMYDRFQQGEIAMNPKHGNVLGTISVWNGRDMISAPIGRVLHRPGAAFSGRDAHAVTPTVRLKTHEDMERVYQTGTKMHDQAENTKWASRVGPAVATVEPDRVTLDLLTTFPEQTVLPGSTEPAEGVRLYSPLDKHNFGPAQLIIEQADGTRTTVGSVAYDRQTYESQAGVVEVPLSPEVAPLLNAGSMLLVAGDGMVLLQEVDVVQVETDDRNVYLDLQRVNGELVATGQLELRAFWKGQPIEDPVTVGLQYFEDVMDVGTANSLNPLVVTACEISDQLDPSQVPDEVTIPAGGRATISVTSKKPGCFKVRFVPPHFNAPSEPNFLVEFFGNYRVLPFDDYSDVPDERITAEFVYEEVFKYYAIMYPIMGQIIPWGPTNAPYDPDRIVQFASLIRQAVDKSRLGTAMAMPITRELSDGKRALVQRWCDLQLTD